MDPKSESQRLVGLGWTSNTRSFHPLYRWGSWSQKGELETSGLKKSGIPTSFLHNPKPRLAPVWAGVTGPTCLPGDEWQSGRNLLRVMPCPKDRRAAASSSFLHTRGSSLGSRRSLPTSQPLLTPNVLPPTPSHPTQPPFRVLPGGNAEGKLNLSLATHPQPWHLFSSFFSTCSSHAGSLLSSSSLPGCRLQTRSMALSWESLLLLFLIPPQVGCPCLKYQNLLWCPYPLLPEPSVHTCSVAFLILQCNCGLTRWSPLLDCKHPKHGAFHFLCTLRI